MALVQGQGLVVELLQVTRLRLTSSTSSSPSSQRSSGPGLAAVHPLAQAGQFTVNAGDGLYPGSSPG